MDFGMLPPEINSWRMYSGPGPGPMLAAAAAWDGVASELRSAAVGYGSVISGLTSGSWLGASASSMTAAAAPFVTWLAAAADQAAEAAAGAKAAAAAFETAYAMTVPPPLITANRAQLMSLIATNVVGQNSPAIAATEAHYDEMWAQDAAAMYGYAASEAVASKVTAFASPPITVNPAGLAGQGVALAQTAGTSSATETQAALTRLTAAVPQALQSLSSPGSSTSSTSLISAVNSLNTLSTPARTAAYLANTPITSLNSLNSIAKSLGSTSAAAASSVKAGESGVARGLGSLMGATGSSAGLGSGGPSVSAGIGQAVSVGPLSVPQAWAAAPSVSAAGQAAGLTGTTVGAAPATGSAGVPPVMPIGSMGGRGLNAPASQYSLRPTVIPRSPSAG
jgi:PPE-repeat protein